MEPHHSFIHLLTPQVLLSTTCQALAILGLHQHIQQTWSGPLKPAACEGTTSISVIGTILKEAVQGDRDPVNRKLDPRLERSRENKIWKGLGLGKFRGSLRNGKERVVGTKQVTGQMEQDGAAELVRNSTQWVSGLMEDLGLDCKNKKCSKIERRRWYDLIIPVVDSYPRILQYCIFFYWKLK